MESILERLTDLVIIPTNSGLFEIKRDGRGVIPVALHGFYTSESKAREAIARYAQNRI